MFGGLWLVVLKKETDMVRICNIVLQRGTAYMISIQSIHVGRACYYLDVIRCLVGVLLSGSNMVDFWSMLNTEVPAVYGAWSMVNGLVFL